ncbi:TlyA family RNA methyltransferase [Vallitalea okinawensis]|uniref:TlyA family RNA methyltransferase n=1 Tax=Vallitalea okinawensis TaxID=2078660 RepID=UPI000CFBBC06|nr:TlyA family RNA methyltransferase [Vallitalea okinawensis]
MAAKERLDVLLVQRNLAPSREKAKTIIMTGNVLVNNQKEDKVGTKVSIDAEIRIKGNPLPYVSRGGLKLEKAIKEFDLVLTGLTCADIGASTGGFTDCMLQNGAKKVFSIDVGYGQLAWSLRNNPQVVCMEKTNVRYVTPEDLGENVDFASIDVSFISLDKIMDAVVGILGEQGQIVCLIKPQFEAGREKVGRKGVVRDPEVHKEVINRVISQMMNRELVIKALSFSPIRGPEGNIEYLLHLSKVGQGMDLSSIEKFVDDMVSKSHENLVK